MCFRATFLCMRRILFFAALLSALSACKKDDDDTFGFGGNPVPFDTAYYYNTDC